MRATVTMGMSGAPFNWRGRTRAAHAFCCLDLSHDAGPLRTCGLSVSPPKTSLRIYKAPLLGTYRSPPKMHRLALLLVLCARSQPCAALSCGRRASPRAHRRCASPALVSELEWRRQQQERPGDEPADEAVPAKRERRAAASSDVDDLEFFGAVGGGTLTREGMKQAVRASRAIPVVEAETALMNACKETSEQPPIIASKILRVKMEEAVQSGVSVGSPAMKQAAQLLSVLESAAENDLKVILTLTQDRNPSPKPFPCPPTDPQLIVDSPTLPFCVCPETLPPSTLPNPLPNSHHRNALPTSPCVPATPPPPPFDHFAG